MKRWKKKKSRIIGGGIALLIVWYIFCLPRQLFHVPYSTVVADRHHELLGARIAPDGQWRFPPRTTTPEKIKTCLLARQSFLLALGSRPVGNRQGHLSEPKSRSHHQWRKYAYDANDSPCPE